MDPEQWDKKIRHKEDEESWENSDCSSPEKIRDDAKEKSKTVHIDLLKGFQKLSLNEETDATDLFNNYTGTGPFEELFAEKEESIESPSKNKEKNESPVKISFTSEIHDDNTRIMKDVPAPLRRKLTMNEVYKDDVIQIDVIKEHLILEGRLEEDVQLRIIHEATNVLKTEPNLLEINSSVVIVGDIHGQFYDLLRIFELGGPIPQHTYLFLGDYVDRGYFSIECVLYLWALKVRYPENIYLLRGNHECRHVTQYFSFHTECDVKYSLKVYDACVESFDCLPLAAVVENSYFLVHGGISPELHNLKDINSVYRFSEPPNHGLLCDLLWADPFEDYGAEKHKKFFAHNPTRGCSYYFSYAAVCDFLARNDLKCVIRAHEAQEQGYMMYHKINDFPSLMTLFSSPNYCDVYGNKGAIIVFDKNAHQFHVKQFKESPHPYWLPNFTNVFDWSLPFVGEKVTEMLLAVLNICPDDELQAEEKAESSIVSRKEMIKNKIRSVGKVAASYKQIRRQREMELALKSLSPVRSSVQSVLELSAIDTLPDFDHELSFEEAKSLDASNEKLPPSAMQ